MARIRSIKPEFWTSEQVIECSMAARLLFIGMWNFADDYGNIPGKVRELKAKIFPGDEITHIEIFELVRELSKNGLVLCYEVDGQEFLHVTGWHHQRIDKKQKARYPGPDQDNSQTIPGLLPPDRIGKDRIGGERTRAHTREAAAEKNSNQPSATSILDRIAEIANADPVKNPMWMSAGTVSAWLAEGIAEQTIIATVQAVMDRRNGKGPPGSPSYFTGAIREAHEETSKATGHGAPPAAGEWSQAHKDRLLEICRLRGFVEKGVRVAALAPDLTREQAQERLAALEEAHKQETEGVEP